jgi:hypothetical protein
MEQNIAVAERKRNVFDARIAEVGEALRKAGCAVDTGTGPESLLPILLDLRNNLDGKGVEGAREDAVRKVASLAAALTEAMQKEKKLNLQVISIQDAAPEPPRSK